MEQNWINPFLTSVKQIIKQMSTVEVQEKGSFEKETQDISSYGVTSIISFVGKVKGRLLLDMEEKVAIELAKKIHNENFEKVKEPMVLATVSEINNIVAGDANTYLNNEYNLGLRLAPPIILAGKDMTISIPKIESSTIYCMTDHGKIKINVAFEKGGYIA